MRKYSRPWVLLSWFAPSHTIVRCVGEPVRGQHGAFSAAIGPFRTMRAAKLMAVHGAQYPTVADAERAARIHATQSELARAYYKTL